MPYPDMNVKIERPILSQLPGESISKSRLGNTRDTKKRKNMIDIGQEHSEFGKIEKPNNLLRTTSLPAKLEHAPPTRKLFWFRPSPSAHAGTPKFTCFFRGRIQHPSHGKDVPGKCSKESTYRDGWGSERIGAFPTTLEEYHNREDLVGLAFLANDE
jgi:hypothetical protein